MDDFPWWIGLAPLMGVLLDALCGTIRERPALPAWAWQATARFEFVLRTAFRDRPGAGGAFLAICLAFGVAAVTWFASIVAYAFYEHASLFVVWSAIFFSLVSVRRLTLLGISIEGSLREGQTDLTVAAISELGPPPTGRSEAELAGAAVRHITGAMLEAAFVPIAWGALGGPILAAPMLALHEAARFSRASDDGEDPFWAPVRWLDGWVTMPASWLAGLVAPLAMPIVGGSRGQTIAGFVTRFGATPTERLSGAIARGLSLNQLAGGVEDLADPTCADVQRTVLIVWVTCLVGAAVASGLSALGCHWL